ncbi:TPA: ATP-binding protein [Pseudomonas aeruginosa]|nr:ATP-binding protein [Pseudomonas aeruginosa]HBO9142658.1 ATP-binding protein [Pseudomonas aeruginosa]HBO9245764.1 ATP-binding protein [Pseudomonas aeruginosa]HBO9315337.1 ATP-binding protein [Pseudomonas aeruginosa]HBO9741867.1 ATP-binding protein [Pseudomonas aeruginosa]
MIRVSSYQEEFKQPFRPRARILQLLGDELIGSHKLAVFELVKNSYDAGANEVSVVLDLSDSDNPRIIVKDDGDGMSLQTIQDVWLVPGNDHRKAQRESLIRRGKYHRLPLGEKGLGRFAVHKLGNLIRLTTRAAGLPEYVVEINWEDIIDQPFLDEAPITIKQRSPEVFVGDSTGTLIEISDLRNKGWKRGEVRSLYKQITSICSPFEGPESFVATVDVPGHEEWLRGLLDTDAILSRAPWKFNFDISVSGEITWNYEFRSIPGINLEGRKVGKTNAGLLLPKNGSKQRILADKEYLLGVGPIKGEFYVYDREREVLKLMSDVQMLTDYLDENGGVRIYRDGIRVYNYGEPGVDWLGLDLRRVNRPTRKISNNLIIGVIHLSLKDSRALLEKTNREGFVENDAMLRLESLVLSSLAVFETERDIDKERVRKAISKSSDPVAANIERPIEELRGAMRKHGVLETFEPYINKLEEDYHSMQETLLAAGMSGLNLAVVFHEVERGVRTLHRAIEDGADIQGAARQAKDLTKLLDGFSGLLRRDDQKAHDARKLILRARDLNLSRMRFHKVQLECPFLETEEKGFSSIFPFGLVLNALVNLIDNALYWLQVRWPDSESSSRKIYIGISNDFELGPAIVIADNGPGFQDDAENMVRPFFTRKAAGMGLGLYYANLAMGLSGGLLAFPDKEEVELPAGFDGAVIALIFKEAK